MQMPESVIIVEDEVITQRYLKDILKQHKVNIVGCYDNAKDAMLGIRKNLCDMILMDINIKGPTDGIQLAMEVLKLRTVPIIFITAHGDEETFQEVLSLSPYGFITKPFSAKNIEMTLQLAYMRYKDAPTESKVVTPDLLQINKQYSYSLSKSTLYSNAKVVKLNVTQSKLLEALSTNINKTITYEMLVSAVWGNEEISDSALRTLVYSIRKVLPGLPLCSYSKVGYSLEVEE